MALWKAVSDRHDLLLATWDGGRVGPAERERLSCSSGVASTPVSTSALDAAGRHGAGALAVSLPEACRLSDALAGQLRVRLALDPAADENARRIKALCAQLGDPHKSLQAQCQPRRGRPAPRRIGSRTDDLVARFDQGGDVGGLLRPLGTTPPAPNATSSSVAWQRELVDDVRDLTERRAALRPRQGRRDPLRHRQLPLWTLPNYAVPDVDAGTGADVGG